MPMPMVGIRKMRMRMAQRRVAVHMTVAQAVFHRLVVRMQVVRVIPVFVATPV